MNTAPVTYAQEVRLRFFGLKPTKKGAVVRACRVGIAVDTAILRRCLELLSQRHDSLRLSFRCWKNEYYSLVGEQATIPLAEANCPAAREDEVLDFVSTFVESGLDDPWEMDIAPLFRAAVVHAERGDVIILAGDHTVVDGWSIGLAMNDLLEYYAREEVGRELPRRFGTEAPSFQAWSRREREAFAPQSEHRARAIDFWRDHLGADGAFPQLPFIDQETNPGDIATSTLSVGPDLLQRLQESWAHARVPYSVFAMALSTAALTRVLDLGESVVNCISMNRQNVETLGLVGWLSTLVPYRYRTDQSAPLDVVGIKRTMAKAADNITPLWLLTQELRPDLIGEAGPSLPPQIILNLFGAGHEKLPASLGFTASVLSLPSGPPRRDGLYFTGHLAADALKIEVTHNSRTPIGTAAALTECMEGLVSDYLASQGSPT